MAPSPSMELLFLALPMVCTRTLHILLKMQVYFKNLLLCLPLNEGTRILKGQIVGFCIFTEFTSTKLWKILA